MNRGLATIKAHKLVGAHVRVHDSGVESSSKARAQAKADHKALMDVGQHSEARRVFAKTTAYRYCIEEVVSGGAFGVHKLLAKGDSWDEAIQAACAAMERRISTPEGVSTRPKGRGLWASPL